MEKIVGGLSQGMSLEDLSKKHNTPIDKLQTQLNKGIEIEKEHTPDESIAKEIAMDHLFEDPNYYDKLATIEEAKQVGILYHYTKIETLISIIKDNEIISRAVKNARDLGVEKKYYRNYTGEYISFTRDQNFHRKVRDIKGYGTRIVLDGNKLSENYKIIPKVDASYKKGLNNFEAEERILGKIKDLDKYVISYDIFIPQAELEYVNNEEDIELWNNFRYALLELKKITNKLKFYKENKETSWEEISKLYNLEDIDNQLKKYNLDKVAESLLKDEKIQTIESLINNINNYALSKNYNIKPLPEIKFVYNDIQNAKNPLAHTGHYDPNLRYIHLYTLNRHPKDVLRTYCHELIHHIQNLENRLHQISTDNINEDDKLKELEREAYEKGNLLLREWENSFKVISESKYEELHPELRYWALYANLYDSIKKNPNLYDELKQKLKGEQLQALEYFYNFLEDEVLVESKQRGNLYHFTDFSSFLNIIKDNKLNSHLLNAFKFIKAKKSLPNIKGVSTTRNKFFYQKDPLVGTGKLGIRIVLDGNKLSTRYKIVPYNYFDSSTKHPFNPKREENEEVIVTKITNYDDYNDYPLKDLDKYVVSYDVLLDKLENSNGFLNKLNVLSELTLKNIRFFYKEKLVDFDQYIERLQTNKLAIAEKNIRLASYDDFLYFSNKEQEKYPNIKTCIGICFKEDKILVGKSTSNDERKNLWVFPGGGWEPNGETLKEGAIRELWEEAGIISIYTDDEPILTPPLSWIKCKYVSGDLKPNHEFSELLWIDPKDLGNKYPTLPNNIEILKKLEGWKMLTKSRLKEIGNIKEAKQRGKLYHFTSVEGLYRILINNILARGLNGSVSLTRNPDFYADSINSTQIRLTLDGDKLSENYKIKPHNDPDFSIKGGDSASRDHKYRWTDSFESEEKIEKDIKNIKKYIISINVTDVDLLWDSDVAILVDLINQGYKINMPDDLRYIIAGKLDNKIQKIAEYKNQDILNPVIWENNNMKPQLREVLQRIGETFYKGLEVDLPLEDILLIGSSANYNWTKYSDIDLHLLMNFQNQTNPEIFKKYFDSKKIEFNQKYNLQYKGHNIEVYVQDINEPNAAQGVYSILKGEWIQEPPKEKIDIPDELIQKKAQPIMNQIDLIIDGEGSIEDIKKLKEKIRNFRKSGLEQGGEYSLENLAFKTLRYKGYLEKLNNYQKEKQIEDFGIENIQEAKQRGILYHYTSLDYIIDILGYNILKARPLYPHEINKRILFPYSNFNYISFTRNKDFNIRKTEYSSVRIVLDGNKLSENYKILPYSYWTSYDDWEAQQKTKLSQIKITREISYDESEERLLTKKEGITNLDDYVLKYEILIDTKNHIGYLYNILIKLIKINNPKITYYINNKLISKEEIENFINSLQEPKQQVAESKKSRKEKLFDLALRKDPKKLTELGQEIIKYDAWVVPDLETLKREYHVEHELKGNKFFNSLEEFLKAIKEAKIETISSSDIAYTTQTDSYEDLLSLIKSYKSYPEFRNETTLKNLYTKFKTNQPLDYPIIIEFSNGRKRIFSGNTRLNVAEQLGIECKGLIIKSTLKESLDEAKQRGILYHFTSQTNFPEILKTNSLIGNEDIIEDKPVISLTRDSRFESYFLGVSKHVRIVLNGDKLTNRYKIIPYNDRPLVTKNPSPWNEQEERIYTKEIKNLDDYVISYDILLDRWVGKDKIIPYLDNPKVRILYYSNGKLHLLPKSNINKALKIAEDLTKKDLNRIEGYADNQLAPEDIEFSKHFFERLNDPRNGEDISLGELMGFFGRLKKYKDQFIEFLKKYKEIVAVDDKTKINIPFVTKANKAIAKTILRKKDFETRDPKLVFEAKQIGNLYHFTSFSSALQIIADNKLGKLDTTISTTRDKNFIRDKNRPIGGSAIGFILDGDKLSNKYKIRPYDYNFDNPQEEVGDEQEETIWGKKLEKQGGINNLDKYIKGFIFTKQGIKYLKDRAAYGSEGDRLGDFIIPSEFKQFISQYNIDEEGKINDDDENYELYLMRDGNYRTTFYLSAEDKFNIIKSIIEYKFPQTKIIIQ